ncbi:MAG: hypothetical protein V1921_04985 [Candidatus Altiarchaeota archaeon]
MAKVALALLFLMVGAVSAQVPGTTAATAAASLVCGILTNVKVFFEIVAAGLAIVLIAVNGWRIMRDSAEEGSAKKAKESITHTIVGLIIVVLAVEIVALVMGGGCAG